MHPAVRDHSLRSDGRRFTKCSLDGLLSFSSSACLTPPRVPSPLVLSPFADICSVAGVCKYAWSDLVSWPRRHQLCNRGEHRFFLGDSTLYTGYWPRVINFVHLYVGHLHLALTSTSCMHTQSSVHTTYKALQEKLCQIFMDRRDRFCPRRVRRRVWQQIAACSGLKHICKA